MNATFDEENPPMGGAGISDAAIYREIFDAIVEGRLVPGAKLGQDELASAFGVSKTRVRPILYQLASQGVVAIRLNRGAFVAAPSLEEALAVNEVRYIMESGIMRRIAGLVRPDHIRELYGLVEAETQARREGAEARAHRLTGQFHLYLAGITGNHALEELLEQLISRDSLAVAMYQDAVSRSASIPEHTAIVRALEENRPELAEAAMTEHLAAIRERLMRGRKSARPLSSLARRIRSST